ncbi:MAG TPA: thiol:disulfide interchange protein DsbA/DsbL [Burkholderiales bacterium]|nr:thiol:disulfide interchange protein DsbA/DsbL [Burkholderiales bacterium]
MIVRIVRALAALLAAAALAPAALAQQTKAPFLYLNPPIATDSAGKVEVVEFFWYECPHCYDLEPLLDRWIPKLGKDVQFKRVPATFNERWRLSARVFYALESMGVEDKLHKPLMDAIHKDRMRIAEPPGSRQGTGEGWTVSTQTIDWLQKQGVDVAKFQAALKSFAVESRLKRADQLVRDTRLDGVPALMVNGRYLVTTQGGSQQMLDTADALIEQARKETASAPAAKK